MNIGEEKDTALFVQVRAWQKGEKKAGSAVYINHLKQKLKKLRMSKKFGSSLKKP
jgi:hypothetical protein